MWLGSEKIASPGVEMFPEYFADCTETIYSVLYVYYKLEGRGLDSRWRHWIFQLIQSIQPHNGP
jgi:hypothetical protein